MAKELYCSIAIEICGVFFVPFEYLLNFVMFFFSLFYVLRQYKRINKAVRNRCIPDGKQTAWDGTMLHGHEMASVLARFY